MDEKRRNFFAAVVQQSKQLSECPKPKAAVIVRGESICGIGYNKTITGDKEDAGKGYVETSPVFEAIKSYISRGNFEDVGQEIRGDTPKRGSAFLSYFPHIDELRLLYQTNIFTVYFFGDIDNEEPVKFINELIDFEGEPFFKIIQLLSPTTDIKLVV
jgi:hypothetical protein